MHKTVYLEEHAQKTLDKLSPEIQTEFYATFLALEKEGKLDFPHAKKINKKLFEIRIKIKNIYRAFLPMLKAKI